MEAQAFVPSWEEKAQTKELCKQTKQTMKHKIDLFTSAPLVSSGALATGSSNFHWKQMLILLQLLVSRKIVPKLHFPSFFFFFFAAIPDQAPTRLLSKQCSPLINSLTHCVCALPRWVKEIFFLTFFLAYEQQEYHKRWIRLRLHHRCCCCCCCYYVSSTRQWWHKTLNPEPKPRLFNPFCAACL